MSSGCRVALIIGIIIGAIILVGIVLSYVFCGQITEALVNKTIDALETKVIADLPAEYNADEIKEKFKQFREAVTDQIKNKTLDQTEIQTLSTQVQSALEDEKIDKEELDKILKMIDDVIKNE